jgi:tRNA nucleotidyltransferase (CCA-adding enzyme)
MLAYETGITKQILPEFDQMLETKQENHHHIYSVGMHCLEALNYFAQTYLLDSTSDKGKYSKKLQLILRWTLLLHDVGKPKTKVIGKDKEGHFYGHEAIGADMSKEILKRLKFDNETIDLVYKLIKYHDFRYLPNATQMRKAMNKTGTEHMELLFEVQLADVMAQNPDYQKDKLENLEMARKLYFEIMNQGDCVNLKSLAINGSDLIKAGYRPGKEIGEKLNSLLTIVLNHPEYNTKEQLLRMI